LGEAVLPAIASIDEVEGEQADLVLRNGARRIDQDVVERVIRHTLDPDARAADAPLA
jgi:hypothetical protein